jgi:NNP family nitrate/nitrite transporter-like MFS transporter
MSRLERWEPENPQFWQETGSAIAWRTCAITTFSLIFSFATWFVMSAVVVRMPAIGFKFSTMELFWLAAIPGLASGILRLIHSNFIPVLGTRPVVSIATIIKIIPMLWLGFAIQDLNTPWSTFMIIGFLCGMGGGDFSSFMPSTSIFFPKRLQGLAMGIQAGLGNFGVSIVQFVAPWIVGFAALGAIAGGPQLLTKGAPHKDIWLQNAAFIWVPFLLLAFVLCVVFLRSLDLPTRGFKGQFEILSRKNRARTHTWNCTITYICSFGSFSGFSAAFPLLIKTVYGGFENAPDPLAYAFIGPLIGGLVRMLTGGLFDKIGGSRGMHWCTLGQIAGCAFLVLGGYLTPTSLTQFSGFLWGMLWIFFMSGINNAATFRQYPIVFAYSAAKGAQMLGWTGAWAAFGPFVWNGLIGAATTATGNANLFFIGVAVFYAYSFWVNWYYYTRQGAERYDYGNRGGTWWDHLPEPEKTRMKAIDLGQRPA